MREREVLELAFVQDPLRDQSVCFWDERLMADDVPMPDGLGVDVGDRGIHFRPNISGLDSCRHDDFSFRPYRT